MKKVLSVIASLLVLACLPIGIFLIFIGKSLIGVLILGWFVMLVGACINDLKQSLQKVKKCSHFSMIELIAVISIAAVLLTITMSAMKTDPSKADITRIGGDLKLLQTQARAEKEIKEFILSEDYFSNVTMSHDKLFFNEQGEPVDIDGNQIIGFYVQAHDTKSNPIKVFVRPFTGKVTYLEL